MWPPLFHSNEQKSGKYRQKWEKMRIARLIVQLRNDCDHNDSTIKTRVKKSTTKLSVEEKSQDL